MSSSDVVVRQADRLECVGRCLKMPNCNYINYNQDSDMCEIGLGQCESLGPSAGVMVNVFRQSRDVCLHWGSYQEARHVAVGNANLRVYVGRTVHGEAMVVGKFLDVDNYDPHIWANDQGERFHVDYGSDNVVEVLTTTADCPLFWVSYTGSNSLPVGAVAGGYLASGKATYVARKEFGSSMSFGYYNTDTEIMYYESGGARYSSTMEILSLMWQRFLVLAWVSPIAPNPFTGETYFLHAKQLCWACFVSQKHWGLTEQIEGILPKGPYLPCVSMAGRALWQDTLEIRAMLNSEISRLPRSGKSAEG